MPADVLVYTTQWCPYCRAAKMLLHGKQVAFEEIDVDGRDDLRRWLEKASGQHTVPQVFINGKSMGGYSDINALDQAGELDSLLAEAPQKGGQPLPR